jgi:GDP-4-dehydro-6-deoxy-D-mannose reductase
VAKYLITGVSGFVARHFIDLLEKVEDDADVLGIDIAAPRYAYGHAFSAVDMLDYGSLERAIVGYSPDFVLHLASFSSVARSWERPAECFSNNTNIFLNLAEAVRKRGSKPRILSIGSSEEYGIVDARDIPLREDNRLNPISPYAIARYAQEQLSLIYARSYGMEIIITRSFNHLGPGQEPIFAIPSIAKQFAEAPSGGIVELRVGDISVVRDFLDVRDVVKAYYTLLHDGERGEIYNVCGGKGHSISDIIEMLGRISGKAYRTVVDPSRVRPNDNMVIVGDNAKIRGRFGWAPERDLKQSLLDIYAEFQSRAAS